MPTKRNKRIRAKHGLYAWEHAFLTGDTSDIEPGSRAEARLRVMRRDLDGYLMFGDRTARELLELYPEYKEQGGGHANKES